LETWLRVMTHPPLAERIRRLRALDGESVVRLVA
jgi:Zn-dependent protease with chaperone function